jgi:protein involved in polysaccharide export with SLBB domain/capsular polysaccharide biosynthesis protein
MKNDHASNNSDGRHSTPEADDLPLATPFDFGSLIAAVVIQWRRVATNGLLFLLLGLIAAVVILRPSFRVPVQLSRYALPLASDAFNAQPLTTPALVGMISSPDAIQKAASEMIPPLSAAQLTARLTLTEDRNSELITIMAVGKTPSDAVSLANAFALKAVQSTQIMQKDEAIEAGLLIARQLENSEADSARVRQQLADIESLRTAKERALRLTSSAPTAAKADTAEIARLEDKTQAARDELTDLQARYTDAHPLVREQKARLAALEAQLSQSVTAGKSDGTASLAPETAQASADQSTGYDALAFRLNNLESSHADLVARQRAIELFVTHPPGYLRMMYAATADNVVAQRNRLSIVVLALFCGALGALGTMVFIATRELLDDRLKTGADVKRVTHLPLIATLGNLDKMSPANKASWAFRTWTALQRNLSESPNHGMVCGFTSATPGEGRSTWIDLLSKCARQCGFTVLTISSSEAVGKKADEGPAAGNADEPRSPGAGSTALATLATTGPAELMERLTASSLAPSVNLPLPGGWVWDLDRRKQWQRALNSWKAIDNVVILVELPPVSDPETILLAENMPNLIWLAESHKANASETIEHLETLRNARCRLVGAVLNREPGSSSKPRLARWLGHRSTLLASAFGLMASSASAQALAPAPDAADAVPAQTQSAFAVVDPSQRAPWQQRLTLGPGDLLNLSVFGQPELSQVQVPVGPDGRISYLEAQNIMAAGLTIDEFRAALNSELGKFRSAPEVIVIPYEYRSKKYYVLGAVARTGTFNLNRPMTIIEAVSQAGGLETGVTDHNLAIQADLSRSFISRQGNHLPVDFEKLFLQGDLSQNIPVEPGDYLYFPSGDRQQIYVLGEVRFPGTLVFSPQTSTLEAIAVRGGFSERAWKKRLLVIRGSLDHPQAFVVDANDVLSAKTADFQLQPRDIVYVSSRPWIKAEELLNDAAAAFVQSAVITATGLHVDPIGDR